MSAANNGLLEVYPESWGAIPDGVTDCTSAIQSAYATGYAIRLGTGYYLFSAIRTVGTMPLVIRGSGQLLSRLVQTSAANVGITIGADANVEGSELHDLWINGNSAALGGLALGTSGNLTAHTKLRSVRIDGYSSSTANGDVGAYGVSLNSVQELDVQDSELLDNYIDVYRPNIGFCTSTVFHGQRGFLGRAGSVGVLLAGPCADITFSQQVMESNHNQAILGSGFASVIDVLDCYFEANNVGETAGMAAVDLSGASGSPIKARLVRNHFHLPSNPAVGRYVRFGIEPISWTPYSP